MKRSIIGFLCNPIKTGADCSHVFIPYKSIGDLWQLLSDKAKQKRKRFKVKKMEDGAYLKFMVDAGFPFSIDKDIDDMLNFLIKLKDEVPKEVLDWADYGELVSYPKYFVPNQEEEEGFFFLPLRAYFEDIKDAISIRIDEKAVPNLVLDVATFDSKATEKFKCFLSMIPCLHDKMVYRELGWRHSKRFILDLYPSVAAMWIDELAQKDIQREIIDFLEGALDYLDRREWQMSIILSAIAVEILLADIFEELFREESPAAPIGRLIEDIDKKHNFPADIKKALEALNEMRIMAVHRGITSFKEKDAITALMNTIKFVLWYRYENKSFCNIVSKEASKEIERKKKTNSK